MAEVITMKRGGSYVLVAVVCLGVGFAVPFLLGLTDAGSEGWEAGDLAGVADRAGVEAGTTGEVVLADILHRMMDKADDKYEWRTADMETILEARGIEKDAKLDAVLAEIFIEIDRVYEFVGGSEPAETICMIEIEDAQFRFTDTPMSLIEVTARTMAGAQCTCQIEFSSGLPLGDFPADHVSTADTAGDVSWQIRVTPESYEAGLGTMTVISQVSPTHSCEDSVRISFPDLPSPNGS